MTALATCLALLWFFALAPSAVAQNFGNVDPNTTLGNPTGAKAPAIPMNPSTARTSMGLGTIAVQNAAAVAITGGTLGNTLIGLVGDLGAATADSFAKQTSSQSGLSANQIYNWAFGGGATTYDVVRSVMRLNPGSTVTGMNGFASYIDNELPSASGASKNAVNNFGVCVAGVNNAYCWSANYVLTDSKTQSASALTGVSLIGLEINPNIWATSTVLNGVELVGASGVQPAVANGFVVNVLDISGAQRAKWSTAFLSANGASAGGLLLGSTDRSGANKPSQPININVFDNAGAAKTYQMQGTSGASLSSFNFTHTIGGPVFWTFDDNVELLDSKALSIGFDAVVSVGSHVAAFASAAAITTINIGNNTALINALGPLVLTKPAVLTAANQISVGSGTTTAPNCGGSAIGAAGCWVINVNGTSRNVPFY